MIPVSANTITPPSSLEQLIEGCRRGDLPSQEQLYRHCYPQMIGICVRYAGDLDGAGIIFNNAMLRVFRHISNYQHQNKWIPWIKTIVVHCSIDYVKQRNRLRYEEVLLLSEDAYFIQEDIFQKLSAKEIQQMILQLPNATSTVLNLFIFEGFTHRQIAESLGISEGTSKWHVNEGRKLLKSKLLTLNDRHEQ